MIRDLMWRVFVTVINGNSNVKCGKVVSGKCCVAQNVTRDVD